MIAVDKATSRQQPRAHGVRDTKLVNSLRGSRGLIVDWAF